jgi:integrase
MAFTTRSLAALEPGSGPYEVREVGRTGLRLRVGATSKTFRWACTARGRVYTLGRFGDGAGGTLTLSAARVKLDTYRAKHEAGVDPEELDHGERPKTVKALCDVWYKESILLRRRRPEVVKDVIDREIIPTLGALPLIAVDTLACRRVVARTVKRGATVHAAKVLQSVKQLFNFAAANGFMPANPAAPLRAADLGVVLNVGDRFLSAEEIPPVLDAIGSGGMDPVLRLGLRFVFFAGLRTHEALTLEWRDVDLEEKTIAVRVENQKISMDRARRAKPFTQPLSTPAVEIVKTLRTLAPVKSRWVFHSPQAKGGRVNDKSLEHALRRVRLRDLPKMETFSPHDFRRTLATHMSDTLRLPPWIGQLCLGHSLNRMLGSGVARTYDHAKFLEDRRCALEAYATWVDGLCTGKTAEVIALGGER